MGRNRLLVWAVVGTLAVIVVVAKVWHLGPFAGRGKELVTLQGGAAVDPRPGSRPECPRGGEWTPFFRDSSKFPGLLANGQLSVADPNTDIPEFHDCQQFIATENGAERFISLFAIFASSNLARVLSGTAGSYPNEGIPMGEIYAYDSSYAPLGIEEGFNCLYFYRDGNATSGFVASVRPVHRLEQKCKDPVSTREGTVLDVTATRISQGQPLDYPPVARWDRDTVSGLQYIGIRCGNAWCEVHPKAPDSLGFHSSTSHVSPSLLAGPRVLKVKGWYDEQRLAFPPASPGQGPTVGNVTATLIPELTLGDEDASPDASNFKQHWVPVARVALSVSSPHYAQKLNLVQGSPANPPTRVFLCYSPAGTLVTNSCDVGANELPSCVSPAATTAASPDTWLAKITSEGTSKYFCVIRREHSGMSIPGVVRWRWMLDDDTMWIRCLQGCCEVQPDRT